MTRARILLKMDEGWTAPQTGVALEVSERTVFRTKRRYVEEVLRHRSQVNRYRKVDERVEAHLIALACSPAPEGHDHWTPGCWRTRRWSWGWWSRYRRRRCGCG